MELLQGSGTDHRACFQAAVLTLSEGEENGRLPPVPHHCHPPRGHSESVSVRPLLAVELLHTKVLRAMTLPENTQKSETNEERTRKLAY